MNAGERLAQLFKKNGIKSNPSKILIGVWIVILLWYLLDGFPFLANWPIDEIIVVPILFMVSLYYYGKYSFKTFSSGMTDEIKKYQRSQK